jgi:hypothetical protein
VVAEPGENIMIRKTMIVLAALTFVGAMTASSTGDARAFGGGGFRAGGFGGGGLRGFGGGGLRTGFAGGAFRGGFGAPGRFAFRAGIGPRFGFRNRVFVGNRFFPRRFARRFAFAAVPFGIYGYGPSCWRWIPTAWGWERTWVCGYDYGYGNGYYGYY